MLKNHVQVMAVVSVLFLLLSSCQKNVSKQNGEDPIPPVDTNVSGENIIPIITGVLVTSLDSLTTDSKISVLEKLNVQYTRTSLVMSNWDGYWDEFERFDAGGYKVFANICYGKATALLPSPYTKDTISYKKTLSDILDTYSPAMVIIENEETDVTKHSGSMKEYINELTAAIGVVHQHGLKGTNGGLSIRPLTYLVYRYYYNKGEYDKADDFAQRCIPERFIYNISHPGTNPVLEDKLTSWDSLITAYKTIPIDYVNAHIYEPIKYRGERNATALSKNITEATPGALQEICDYLTATIGKKIISTEMGQLNKQPNLVVSMLDTSSAAGLKYLIWYSGDGGPNSAVALHNPDGTLRNNGVAFRNYTY